MVYLRLKGWWKSLRQASKSNFWSSLSLLFLEVKGLALILFTKLESIPLTLALPSRINDNSLAEDLKSFLPQIILEELDILLILPLIEKIYSQASDQEICNSLFALAEGPSTPPPASPILSTFAQTPWKDDVSCFVNTSELKKDVDPILKAESSGNLMTGHPEFFDTFFGQVPQLSEMAPAVFRLCQDTVSKR